ncbi:phenylalanine--tRNA ligase subunit alpha [Arsenophonus symbiont of Ornithomya chloropus]|uniref:phenylalanine--tRNA ligase subunit alpha n=1 Tax=Arsenophonus symbiont of Ornithomya chloropus TaxID=634121 RepID=UPI0032B21BB8
MLQLTKLAAQAKEAIKNTQNFTALNSVRIEFLGKKGHFASKLSMLRNLSKSEEERVLLTIKIHKIKNEIKNLLRVRKKQLENNILNEKLVFEKIDVSLPGRFDKNGSLHPVNRTIEMIEEWFVTLGFSVVSGFEIEDDYHNFDALNIPIYHPVRISHDTFWFNDALLLRTQTSGIQIRIMKRKNPPIRIISSGRVYRNDYDQTHTPMFHQTEGLIIDKNINFSNLKDILHAFLNYFFEEKIKVRFRSSYFPFTEPSAEVDVMGSNGKWLEVLGCGMVHPNVLRNVNLNHNIYTGFAFGMGIERLTMLRYKITDARIFFENDLRFLKQFR